MNDVAQRVTNLRAKYEDALSKKSRLEGELSSVMSRLSTEFSVSTVEEANTLLEKLKTEKADKERQVDEVLNNVELILGGVDASFI